MKFLRKVSINIVVLLISILCFSFTVSAVSFDEINSPEIFLKQNDSDTCTLAAAAMLVRRAAYASGNANWSAITENSMRSTAWVEGVGLRFNFTYSGISVKDGTMSGNAENTTALIALLKNHPEGIVIYDYQAPHAILVTDYTNGQFYCADPARNVASGRIPVSLASISVNNADAYWYVSSPSVSVQGSASGSESGSSSSDKNENVGPTVSGMKTISRPSEIDGLENQDLGMIFYKAKWNSLTTITVPERGWVIMDTTYDPWIGAMAVYMNPSLTKAANRFYNGRVGGFGRNGFYLEKGTYYVQAYDGGGGYVSFSDDLEITIYAYFIPSSSVLSTSVSLAPDSSAATLHCTSTMGDGTFYRWVKDVSTTDKITEESFYSNRSAIADIEVRENGTYSVRISSNNQEWESYPVDVQITVNGIAPKSKECEHEYKVVTDQEPTCAKAGSQHQECTICGHKETSTVIPATGNHTYGNWAVVEQATATKTGSKQRTCSVCGAQERRSVEKLVPTIKLSATSIKLKVKQSTTKVKVSGLARGDAVASWKSSNTKIVTVNNKGKITAKAKKGKATITVTLKSGLSRNIIVTVQKQVVACTKITLNKKSITLKKGKTFALKATINPFTCVQKAKYTTSNKSVATVSASGKIKAKKKGTATITVTVGKKKATCKVKVK